MSVIINTAKGSRNISCSLSVHLLQLKEESSGTIASCGVPGREDGLPTAPRCWPGGRIRPRDLAPFPFTRALPEPTERSRAPCHRECFHFLDGNMQTICSKEGASIWGAGRNTRARPPAGFRSAWIGVTSELDCRTRLLSQPEGQIPGSRERDVLTLRSSPWRSGSGLPFPEAVR